MEHAIEYCQRKQVAWIKLDATDMGAPLYRKLGFTDECAIERWGLRSAPRGSHISASAGFDANLDHEAFGADRRTILERIAAESILLPGCGYAVGRPGSKAAYFGPCVALTPDAARSMLEWFLDRHSGESVYWDLLPGNAAAFQLAKEFHFERKRQLIRMARPGVPAPAPLRNDDSKVYAIAGFEYG